MGLAAAERAAVPEDTCITGHDRALAEELGARGWLGMTWPAEHGGGRARLHSQLDFAPASLAHPGGEFLSRPPPLRANDLLDRPLDERLAQRLIDVNQHESRPVVLGHDPRPLGHPPAHRRQVECSKHPSHVVALPLIGC